MDMGTHNQRRSSFLMTSGVAVIWLILALFACEKPKVDTKIAFYYWKTDFLCTPETRDYLDNQGAQKVYLRLFDLAIDGQDVAPNAIIKFQDALPSDLEIVPVIYITNSVWKRQGGTTDTVLADSTLALLEQLRGLGAATSPWQEVQFDCDWTRQTRERYFSFLRLMSSKLAKNCAVSATIRLHQYREPVATGIPPVQRGMLMLYQSGDIDDPTAENTILTTSDAQKWLKNAKPYPIPLDVAIPAYRWTLVYRMSQLQHIINDLDPAKLATDTSLFYQVMPNRYFCQRNAYFEGYYMHEGDFIRFETVDTATVRQVYQEFCAKNEALPATCAVYHLDTFAMQTDWRAVVEPTTR
jgi:hypothetical protein